MPEIKLSLDNINKTKNVRENRIPTVFTRSYAQLAVKKLNPGKIIPLFTHINNDYKTFGVFSLNGGGSVSFFPDFYNLNNFDHLTLSADFINKGGHLTKIESTGERPKIIHLAASMLKESGCYHLITFGMESDDLLMDSLDKIELPSISYATEDERVTYTEWIENSVGTLSTLDFPDGNGSYFIQILILPKEKSSSQVAIERTFVEKLAVAPTNLEGKTIACRKTVIATPDNCDFLICILTFRNEGGVHGSFGFIMAEDPSKITSDELKSKI